MKIIKQKRLCPNCLIPGHTKVVCNTKGRCRAGDSKGKHSTGIQYHNASNRQSNQRKNNPPTPKYKLVTTTTIVAHQQPAQTKTVAAALTCEELKIAIAPIYSGKRTEQSNIPFDEGAKRSFITKDFATLLGLKPTRKVSSFSQDLQSHKQIPDCIKSRQ